MTNNLRVPSFSPRCPECQSILEGCGFPLPSKGSGYCPQGGIYVDFEVEIDEAKIVKDKNGKLTKSTYWKMGNTQKHG